MCKESDPRSESCLLPTQLPLSRVTGYSPWFTLLSICYTDILQNDFQESKWVKYFSGPLTSEQQDSSGICDGLTQEFSFRVAVAILRTLQGRLLTIMSVVQSGSVLYQGSCSTEVSIHFKKFQLHLNTPPPQPRMHLETTNCWSNQPLPLRALVDL